MESLHVYTTPIGDQRYCRETVRRVKGHTCCIAAHRGLNESWWADSMECYTYLRNVTNLLSDGKTPYERRFGKTIWRTCYSIWFIG